MSLLFVTPFFSPFYQHAYDGSFNQCCLSHFGPSFSAPAAPCSDVTLSLTPLHQVTPIGFNDRRTVWARYGMCCGSSALYAHWQRFERVRSKDMPPSCDLPVFTSTNLFQQPAILRLSHQLECQNNLRSRALFLASFLTDKRGIQKPLVWRISKTRMIWTRYEILVHLW